ncbi:D-isomer specific 2-hydroxyacid dehydrogenase [Plectosphaerella plurivora]|uniref:D-isomer specific 2-hydroxyacid dehydrogenase n=1 Tax=Plectosphaerella plurivora TaxID=936078 RepID=A0A9P8V4B4_9PEZI|nr:D-isomer specific 2-hydroxyacid dehydrogenase [Plectosphaerella plurivora]
MSAKGSLLLIGDLYFVRQRWEELGHFEDVTGLKEFPSGSREDFLQRCGEGEYDDVIALYRSNDSAKVTGPFNEELVSRLPASLKYICHNGAGYDNIDVAACTARGIQVSNTPRAVDGATADTAIFLMLGALRLANISLTALRQGQWGTAALPMAHDPAGKVLGILGMGSIGRAVASRARAFGMKIQYHNRSRLSEDLEAGATYVDFDTLLATSDVFSLNLSLDRSTKHIIGRPELAKMKHGVTIVNTARGGLMDEAALVEALQDGDRIWSAGLDVFEDEPRVHPGLLANPRVFLLPHIGTMTMETREAMEQLVLDNIKSSLATGRLLTRVQEQASLA